MLTLYSSTGFTILRVDRSVSAHRSAGILKGSRREPESCSGLMDVSQSQFGGIIRRLISVGLVLWLGGAACVLGCESSMSAATVDVVQASDSTESCPWGTDRDCCHRAEEESGKPSVGMTSSSFDAMMCCPLAGHSTVGAGKSSVSDAPASALSVRAILPGAWEWILAASTARGLRVPDRRGTYLRCCVFLI
jgi:hypothetical protein